MLGGGPRPGQAIGAFWISRPRRRWWSTDRAPSPIRRDAFATLRCRFDHAYTLARYFPRDTTDAEDVAQE